MTLPLVDRQKKTTRCSHCILYFSLAVNVVLIVVVALQANNFFVGYENHQCKESVLLDKAVFNLENSFRILNNHTQQLNSELAIADESVQFLYYFHGIVHLEGGPFFQLRQTINRLKIIFHEFNKDIDHFQELVDEIAYNASHLESSEFLKVNTRQQINMGIDTEGVRHMLEDSFPMVNVGDPTSYADTSVQTEKEYPASDVGTNGIIVVLESAIPDTYEYEDYLDFTSDEESSQLKRFIISDGKANWTEALDRCEAQELQLASITSSVEVTEVINSISQADLGPTDFWLAGCDLHTHKSFYWATPGLPARYIDRGEGGPYNGFAQDREEREHCISLVLDQGYRWNDSLCSEQKFYICAERGEPEYLSGLLP